MAQSISTLKGIFLFSSTIVGAGILALPLAASEAGFLPLAAMIVLLAVVSAFSGFYIAESALADQQHPYLPALAKKYLGTWGLAAMLLGIAVNIYGALVGYLAVGGQIFFALSRGAIPVWLGTLIYFVVASLILHRGLVLVSQVNTFLMYAILVLLGILIALAVPRIQVPLLVHHSWSSVLDVFGVVLFAYLGHAVIPSIVSHLKNKRHIAMVVSMGIALPCALYLLWSIVVLGVVPPVSETGHSLSAARAAGQPATIPLGFILGGSVILLGNVFAVLSTMSSYIGLGVSLKDSYEDLAAAKQRPLPALAVTGLVVVPPLVLALLHPGALLHSLEIAGTFGGGLFVGILPVLIVMQVRRSGTAAEFRTKGGAVVPWLVLLVYALGMLFTAARLAGALN